MRYSAAVTFLSLLIAACSGASTGDDWGNGSGAPGQSGASEDGGASGSSNGAGQGSSSGGSGASSSSGGSPGGSSSGGGSSGGSSGGATSGSSSGATSGSSSGSSSGSPTGGGAMDAGSTPTGADAGESPPTRNNTCTPLSQQTGTAVNTNHGRMDGTLVYILPIDGSSSCNGDGSHVHLQVAMGGDVYDVAVDIGKSGDEVGWYQQTAAMPGGAWAEGWHGSDALGYSSLGLSSSQFMTLDPNSMASEVESLLANTSQISIYCTGYTPGDNGCHDVHYQDGTSQDGAIVLNPMSPTSQIVFFHFTGQSF
jgi:hypothetical protein